MPVVKRVSGNNAKGGVVGAHKVCIGISCYNEGRNLGYILGDLLGQVGLEGGLARIVVVDDCSEDDSPSIARSYVDRGVTLIQHERRCGSTATWNTIFAQCLPGEILVKIDGDIRIFAKSFLRDVVSAFKRQPGLDLLYWPVIPMRKGRNLVEKGTAFIYDQVNRRNAMGFSAEDTLFCAGFAAAGTLASQIRIPDHIVANDLYLAAMASDKHWTVGFLRTAGIYVWPARSIQDFVKQAHRQSAAGRQIARHIRRKVARSPKRSIAFTLTALKDPLGFFVALYLVTAAKLHRRHDLRDAWEIASSTKG